MSESTVAEAVEAGARALAELNNHTDPATGDLCASPEDRVSAQSVLLDAWPILTAGLRELHKPDWVCGTEGCPECLYCAACDHPSPCATARELDRIDQELGIGDGQ